MTERPPTGHEILTEDRGHVYGVFKSTKDRRRGCIFSQIVLRIEQRSPLSIALSRIYLKSVLQPPWTQADVPSAVYFLQVHSKGSLSNYYSMTIDPSGTPVFHGLLGSGFALSYTHEKVIEQKSKEQVSFHSMEKGRQVPTNRLTDHPWTTELSARICREEHPTKVDFGIQRMASNSTPESGHHKRYCQSVAHRIPAVRLSTWITVC